MILVDTGFWLALLNKNDSFHKLANSTLEGLAQPLITTIPVITETCHLLSSRLGNFALIRFIRSLDDGLSQLFEIRDSHLSRIEKLMKSYANLPMDFADASLVLLAEHLGHGNILSTDSRDFKTYRWKNTKPFKNLLPV